MPELPEVETVANGVHARVHGATIVEVTLGSHPEPLKSPADLIESTLTGSRIDRVHRVGKTIVFDLSLPSTSNSSSRQKHSDMDDKNSSSRQKHSDMDNENSSFRPKRSEVEKPASPTTAAQFTVHLGMTGRLLVSQPEVPVPLHTHAILRLTDGREIRFVDPRRFGRLAVIAPEKRYEGPGAEPLTIALPDFIQLFRNRKTSIKAALLNQSLLHGVGNIYADESLFRAGIRPSRHAGKLTRAQLGRLHESLKIVLQHAIQLGGSSVSDYVDADGIRGFFQLEHRVYMRTNQPCLVCGTPIKKITIGGRSTHFCPICQK